ncbi:MAG TPA: lysozyme inhibitor LprI family protein [Terracidiphilus sp.]|jgi:uncharacterized protein YecT (DUF1311 family)
MAKFLATVLLCACAAAHATSFDCAKATTPQEKAICASPELSKADDHLAAAYKTTLAGAPAAFRDQIHQAQRAWLRRIRLNCLPGNPNTAIESCLAAAMDARTKALEHTLFSEGGVQFVMLSVSFTVPDSPPLDNQDKQRGVSAVSTFDASWPRALSPAPEWQAWNAAIEDAARKAASQGKGEPDRKWKPEWAGGMDTDLQTALRLVTPRLVSATITNEWYSHGAAHPNTDRSQFHWMLPQRRPLHAEDVFHTGSGWPQILYDRTDKYLHSVLDQDAGGDYQSLSGPGMIAATLHKIVQEPQNWTIDARGITIVFQQYAVACYACTPEPFTMSWDSLKPLLNPEFDIPRP